MNITLATYAYLLTYKLERVIVLIVSNREIYRETKTKQRVPFHYLGNNRQIIFRIGNRAFCFYLFKECLPKTLFFINQKYLYQILS